MDKSLIEYYHNRGTMPDWAYYQQNGKDAFENYVDQHKHLYNLSGLEQRDLNFIVGKRLEKYIYKTFDDIFKDLK